MSKTENGYFNSSYKQWGSKPHCGCVDFTFESVSWFSPRIKLSVTAFATFSSLVLSCNIFQDFKLKFVLMVILVILVFIVTKILLCVRKETLYVIPPVGVQFITTYVIGKESVLFVPWHSVKNFVIVEMIVGQQVFFYLGLQNKSNSSNGLVILFQNTRPRLSHLEEMYRVIVEHSLS